MVRDLYSETKISSSPQRDLYGEDQNELKLPEYPFVSRPYTPSEIRTTQRQIKEGSMGAAQNYLNTPEQIANVFGKHLYNQFEFAPNTPAAKVGGRIGDIASYFLPSNIISLGARGASTIPRINTLLQGGRQFIQSRPLINFLSNVAKSGGEAALFQKEKVPESNFTDVLKAGGIGSVLTTLGHAATSSNPVINALSKTLLGSILGYHEGGLPGVGAGVSAAFLGPRMFREAGYTTEPVSHEMLPQQPTSQAFRSYQAGQRIGDVPTPAEAFNIPTMGARQGEIGRTAQGAEAMQEYGQQRTQQQQTAINNLLDEVYPASTHHENFIQNLYRRSYQHNLPDNQIARLNNDPVFRQASERVQSDPVYQKSLRGIPENNFAYLDQVKRALNDMEIDAKGSRGETTTRSREYGNTARQLTNIMDTQAPIYGVARHHANMKIIRDQMEYGLGKKAITGSNFYKEFLGNENKFNKLVDSLRGNPEAQRTLTDMRNSWNNLIGYDTAKSAAGMAQRHTSSARDGFQKFWNEYKESIGSPRDIERANFIHDPNWWDHFDEVMRYRNRQQRASSLADLISRGLSSGTLEYSKETSNKNKKE